MRVGILDSGKGGQYIGKVLKDKFSIEVFQYKPVFFRSYSSMNMDDLITEVDVQLSYLHRHNVDVIIVGCMTLSTNLIRYITNSTSLPVLNLYSNLPSDIMNTNTLVIATANSIYSGKFNKCTTLITPNLSTSIESGFISLVPGLLRGYEMASRNIDSFSVVLLGCSHYSAVKEIIQEHYSNKLVVDPIDYLVKEFNEKFNKVVSNNTNIF